MTRKIVRLQIAVVIVAALGFILAAQKKPENQLPGISDTWVRLNDNVAISLSPCKDSKKGGDTRGTLRGDFCGTLMVRIAPDNSWHRVLLESAPPVVGVYPIVK